MKTTYVTMILAAQLLGAAAFAQTTNDATTGTQTDTNMSASFGSDWSTSLGTALFADDGTTVRSASEIEGMWTTLSDTDKNLIRRDCMMHMQTTGAETGAASTTDTTGTTDSTGTATGTDSSTGTSTDTTASTGTESASGTTMNVTAENMEQICAAIKDL